MKKIGVCIKLNCASLEKVHFKFLELASSFTYLEMLRLKEEINELIIEVKKVAKEEGVSEDVFGDKIIISGGDK